MKTDEIDSKILIGWYDPGDRRFCYDDVKQHLADSHKGYIVPVYAHVDDTVAKLKRQISELQSELEGKTDEASEAIYQLQKQVEELKQQLPPDPSAFIANPIEDLHLEVVQLQGETYFWALVDATGPLAFARGHGTKDSVEKETILLSARLKLPLRINERS